MPDEARHHPLVDLARAAIECYVRDGRTLAVEDAPAPISGPPAGVFVTLHLRSNGDLRGCIGTIQATEKTLAEEVIQNAIAAAVSDRRFTPVVAAELDNLKIDVSVLHPAERVDSVDDLNPQQYGVIVQRGRRRGLLLPDIPGIDDAPTQVDMARQKAWIGKDEPIEMWRFQVDKFV
jgi:AmmeMemoRadiSam system protein A